MTKRGNKAAAILELLNKGVSGVNICRRLNVSPGYVSTLKKRMAHKAEETSVAEDLDKFMSQEGQVEANEVDAILDARGSRYGSFTLHAEITQNLKRTAYEFAKKHGKTFALDQIEALDMIFHKIGRILNGDPDYADSWIDIAGYAKLVADRLEGKIR
jgi:hypothetical protein